MVNMKIIPITASAGITGFESPASDYLQLPLALTHYSSSTQVQPLLVKRMDIQCKMLGSTMEIY